MLCCIDTHVIAVCTDVPETIAPRYFTVLNAPPGTVIDSPTASTSPVEAMVVIVVGIVRSLLASEAVGLVSTHDLALAKIADELGPRAANVHFEDHLEEGRVVFDYRMRAGVVTKSNALELMRSVGIEV